tara:strand:- start:275 stop:499 length:225 start_codon:yes stop_codon:yes gene_type:complete
MTEQVTVAKITCLDVDCRKATGGYDYFATIVGTTVPSGFHACPECGSGNIGMIGKLNEYAIGYHVSIGTKGVLD